MPTRPEPWESLRDYVGAVASDSEDAFVTSCWYEAEALVYKFIGGRDVPENVIERATLECGSELYHRRSAPNGIAQFASLDGGTAVRVARDPMIGAYPILSPWVGLGVA